jgi:hypothetical protein
MMLAKLTFLVGIFAFLAHAITPQNEAELKRREVGLRWVVHENLKQQYGGPRNVDTTTVWKQIMDNYACLDTPVSPRKVDEIAKDGVKWLAVTRALKKSGPVPVSAKMESLERFFAIIKDNFTSLHTLEKMEALINAKKIREKFYLFGNYEIVNEEGITAKELDCIKRLSGLPFLNQHGSVQKAREYANGQIEKALNDLAYEAIKDPTKITFEMHH